MWPGGCDCWLPIWRPMFDGLTEVRIIENSIDCAVVGGQRSACHERVVDVLETVQPPHHRFVLLKHGDGRAHAGQGRHAPQQSVRASCRPEDDGTRPGGAGQIGGWGIYSDLRLPSTGSYP